METQEATVLVAGGGYAGVLAANRVRGRSPKRVRVVLVTPGAGMTHRVRLHERAVHGTDVHVPYKRLLARGVEHWDGELLSVSADKSEAAVGLHHGETQALRYDVLVMAMGSRLVPSISASSTHALALANEEQALQLSAALPTVAPGARVIIVGGGLTAIELASEIAEAYPALRVEMLCDRFADGLTQGAAVARAALLEELTELGVEVREGVRVQALEPDAVLLDNGTREACAVSVLASGFSAAPLPASFQLPTRPDGRIDTDQHLRVAGLSNVFVVGDLAAPPTGSIGTGLRTTRMSCACAMPLGAHAAEQVVRLLRGRPLQPHSMKYAAQCVSIGRKRAVALFVDADDRPTGRVVRGRKGALIKEAICRMVVGALRVERWLPGFYTWPRQALPTKLIAANVEQSGS